MNPIFFVISFILFVVAVSILIYYLIQYLAIPAAPTPAPNPNQVACSQDALLQAWIQGIPSKPNCPPFVNNYAIVGDNIQMFQNNFQVDVATQCCWFSQLSSQQTYFPNPWICISNVNGTPFTLDQLNQDPYSYNAGTITYLVPPCESNLSQCIGLIWFQNSGQNALYKVFLFNGTSNNLNSADFSDVVFEVSPDCLSLIQVTMNSQVIANGTQLTVPEDQVPSFVPTILSLFSSGRFYPIAGANPPLSELAAS